MNFKKTIQDLPEDDNPYPTYVSGMKKFYADPIGHYKASIARKEKLIEKYQRLIKKNQLSISYLKLLIRQEEEK